MVSSRRGQAEREDEQAGHVGSASQWGVWGLRLPCGRTTGLMDIHPQPQCRVNTRCRGKRAGLQEDWSLVGLTDPLVSVCLGGLQCPL